MRFDILVFISEGRCEITSADLHRMTYLECCIKEAMRVFPHVPMFGRKLCKDTEIGGLQIYAFRAILLFAHEFALSSFFDLSYM